jgi:acetoin utilization deacetylase AcuC-like enzyme
MSLLDRRETFVSNSRMDWRALTFFTTDHVEVPLPAGHRFPMEKYRLLREKLLRDGVVDPAQLVPAPAAREEDLLLAHDRRYVEGLRNNTLPEKELRPIGLTWSPQLLHRSYASVGGFVAATDRALADGFSALLAGGTHHAHADRGEGYCVFNDFAVAALRLRALGKARRILIIDLDVHQGNGNSSILGGRDDVFILSVHGERNFPFRKIPSTLDVALPAGTGDEAYLEALDRALGEIAFDPDVIFYQAGVDNLREDVLGTFDLTFEGLRARDRRVFEFATGRPLALAIGGGYAKPIELTVEAYANTFKEARARLST